MADNTADDSIEHTNDSTRRSVLKGTGTAVAAGALGSLAGCAKKSDKGKSTKGGADSGGTEKATISFWSADAAENSKTKDYYKKSMKNFEEKHGVSVNLQAISYGNLKNKITSAVSAGNAPDIAQTGALGLQFWQQGKTVDHGKYIEQTDGLPENWTDANTESAKYRGKFWAGGSPRHTYTMLAIRPKFFKGVGISDPKTELNTWTKFRRALDKIKKKYDTNAFEVTGAAGDLESYWGEARTAYTEGKDPWIRGDPKDPEILVGKKGRTDGMIKNNIELASTYSSEEAATRGDEQIPSLMLTDRVASCSYGVGNAPRWKAVKSDVTFGWDGDVMEMPIPKLDANYGNEYGFDGLAGKEGQHGGHAWSLEQQIQQFKGATKPDKAWELLEYNIKSPEHVVPLYGKIYPAVSTYKPLNKQIEKQYGDQISQLYRAMLDASQKYTTQYRSTGAAWDLDQTSKIRWKDINETISQAIAGQHKKEETPELIRKRIKKTLGE